MSDPTISVVIPTHQRPTLLQRAIQSVLDQTKLPLEIIMAARSLKLPLTKSIMDC